MRCCSPINNEVIFEPQPGRQTEFLACPADEVWYGGAAGGGKTYALLLDAIRWKNVPTYTATIIRRELKQIYQQGGLFSASESIYRHMGGVFNKLENKWRFGFDRSKRTCISSIQFDYLFHENDKYKFQGAQICMLGFDELTHFTESKYTYLASRTRSTCGVRPYIRATCNPVFEDDKEAGWVRRRIDWWIGEDGRARRDRSGVIRWYARDPLSSDLIWFDREEDAPEHLREGKRLTSFTFISADVYDNKILLQVDPNYITRLESLPLIDREQLLRGNWNIKPDSGMYFRRQWFEVVDEVPWPLYDLHVVRYWDRAACEPKDGSDPDYTVGVKMCVFNGIYYVVDVFRMRSTPFSVHSSIRKLASQDGKYCSIGLEQEAGASGIAECDYLKRDLSEYIVKVYRAEHSKEYRCKPASAASEQGKVRLVRGEWNALFLSELQDFPRGRHDDQVDAFSGAFTMLQEGCVGLNVYGNLNV